MIILKEAVVSRNKEIKAFLLEEAPVTTTALLSIAGFP